MATGNHFFIKAIFYSIITVVVGSLVYGFSKIFGTLLASVLLALALKPIMLSLEVKGLSRGMALTIIFGTFILLIVVGGAILAPMLIEELNTLIEKFPVYQQTLVTKAQYFKAIAAEKFPQVETIDLTEKLSAVSKTLISGLTSALSAIAVNIAMASMVPFIAFFIMNDGHMLNRFLLSMVPNKYFEMTVLLFSKIVNALQLYIRGQIIEASIVGAMTAIGLTLIGLPFAMLIGFVAAVGNLIPYLGPVMATIPALIVVVVTPEWANFTSVLMVGSVFAIVQFIEGTFIYPMVVGKSVELHPLVVLLGLTIGGQVAGIIGMIIVIPLIAMFKVSIEVFYRYLKAYRII